MPRNSKRNGKRRTSKRVKSRTDSLLSELITINRSETIRMSPIKKDQMPMMQSPRDKLYTFWQTITGPQLNSSASLEIDGAITTALSSFGNLTPFVSLFDAYRILQITVRFFPAATPPSSGSEGPLYTAIDYDDATTTPLSSLLEYDTLTIVQPGVFFERVYQPRVADALYSGAFTSFGQRKSPWVDVASAGVIHYGLKYAIPNGTIATNLWNTTVTAVFQFRQTR
jgi:hypothetical protein